MKSILSFGAGVQTTALLVLICEGKWLRPDAVVFADTGDEHQETYDYLANVAIPYAGEHGLTVNVLDANWRTKHYANDLEAYCLEHKMLPGTWVRWCTNQYKIQPINRFIRRELGATKATPVETWIGISMDERRRAVPSMDVFQVKRYPLIELNFDRSTCEQTIAAAGLKVPPKSGCWYCPFQKQSKWQRLKRERPDLFERALQMERNASSKGKKKYLPMFGSLEGIASQNEIPGFDELVEAEGECVTGSCFM